MSLFALYISYDRISITDDYTGPVEFDFYGRPMPKSVHGSIRINLATASLKKISQGLTIRNLNSLNNFSQSSNNFQNSKISEDLNKNLRMQTLENFNNYQRKYSGKNSEI